MVPCVSQVLSLLTLDGPAAMLTAACCQVFGRAYDIFTASNLEDFERKNWFDCQKGAHLVCDCGSLVHPALTCFLLLSE